MPGIEYFRFVFAGCRKLKEKVQQRIKNISSFNNRLKYLFRFIYIWKYTKKPLKEN
jgi:hypothetical protein